MLALLSLSISHSLQPSVESADAPLPGALYLDATFAAKSSSSLCAKGTSGKGCKTVAQLEHLPQAKTTARPTGASTHLPRRSRYTTKSKLRLWCNGKLVGLVVR